MKTETLENTRMMWLIKLLDCPYAKKHSKWHRFFRDLPYKEKHSEEIPGTISDFEHYLGFKFSTGHVRRFLEELKDINVLVCTNESNEYFVDKDALERLIKETATFKEIHTRWFND
jgi:hypothetical protein